MDVIQHVPEHKRLLLHALVRQLSTIPGVAAIALGGSYAGGTHHAASDLDVGVYYDEAWPFAIADIRRIADDISINGTATVTDFYEWGAWVNGGAWIQTAQGKVDILYRNLNQVRRTIAEAQQGVTYHDYDQQPAYGFYSVIYLAETRICIPLYDPDELLSELKLQVETYPPRLREKIVGDSLRSAEFSLLFARDFAAQGDAYNAVGCLTRIAANLTQALFALNERYFIRDKRAMDVIAAFAIAPVEYVERVNRILSCPGTTAQELTASVSDLARVWQDVVTLPGVQYQARF